MRAVDEELASLLTTGQLAGLRAGLLVPCDIRDQVEKAERSPAP